MDDIRRYFEKIKTIPVVVIEETGDAQPLADALVEGGLPCVEITFRTSAAPEVLQCLSHRSDILPGAGSVLNVEQTRIALENGAKFVVSPGLNPKVVKYCLERQIPVFPGVSTPTEFTQALELGLSVLKYFPAASLGGLPALKSMSAPFPMLQFIPTGGINLGNLKEYLQFKQVLACGGSWMVKKELIKQKNFGEIRRLVSQTVSLVREISN